MAASLLGEANDLPVACLYRETRISWLPWQSRTDATADAVEAPKVRVLWLSGRLRKRHPVGRANCETPKPVFALLRPLSHAPVIIVVLAASK